MITKEWMASIIVKYCIECRQISKFKLKDILCFEIKTLGKWEKMQTQSIRSDNFDQLLKNFQENILKDDTGFASYLQSKLKENDYGKLMINWYGNDFILKIHELLETDYDKCECYLQDELGTANIIRVLKSLMMRYREFIDFHEETEIIDDAVKDILFGGERLNFFILKFTNAYNVGVVLSNQIAYLKKEDIGFFEYKIHMLKEKMGIDMVIVITDLARDSLQFMEQRDLLENHNLFYEFIQGNDLQNITIHGLQLKVECDNILRKVNEHRYAQVIFERIMSYLSVISNDIVFQPYLRKIETEKDTNAKDILDKVFISCENKEIEKNLEFYANEIMPKEICEYSYLARHAIYFERSRISTVVNEMIKKRDGKKLGSVVEIGAPNALITSGIVDKCESLSLFTSAFNAYKLMKKVKECMDADHWPDNVSLYLSHFDPEHMNHFYPEVWEKKIDLIVLGYGAASQIDDLNDFLRYAYSWLSDTGVLFLSVYNKEAIIFDMQHMQDQRFKILPAYMPDYWAYSIKENALLKRMKVYSTIMLKNLCENVFGEQGNENQEGITTYPYISTLVNLNEYPRNILDEIREADKFLAPKGTRGLFISIKVEKGNKKTDSQETKIQQEEVPFEETREIQNFLDSKEIDYFQFSHALATDSVGLKRSICEKYKDIMMDTTLLKTVLLRVQNTKSSDITQWKYYIIPYDKRVKLIDEKLELVPEYLVVDKFNSGTISPLRILDLIEKDLLSKDNVFLINGSSINSEYVIVGGETNRDSIKLRTKVFCDMLKRIRVRIKKD